MRLMLVCAALCVVCPINASSDRHNRQEPYSRAVKTAAATVSPMILASYSAPDFTLRAAVEAETQPQADIAEPDSSEQAIAADPVEPERTFSKRELCSTAAAVAKRHDLPVPFFANLIQQESGFKPHAVSPAGAQGIAQFMPRVAAANGVINPFDPIQSLHASGKVLSQLRSQFGNLGLAAAAYNAGPKRVLDWMARRGKLPAETRQYVRNITGRTAEQWVRRHTPAAQPQMPLTSRCDEARAALAQATTRPLKASGDKRWTGKLVLARKQKVTAAVKRVASR
jgi:soluble lytic murein transglycosylase-like protein